MRILVTGATGFVGTRLVEHLVASRRHQVRCAIRNPNSKIPPQVERVEIPDVSPDTDWSRALDGVDAVVHLAAKVHDMGATAGSLPAYLAINAKGTANLARQAATAGVRRFVFLSSVKVNGEEGHFTETDPPHPADAYGVSKLEAESALQDLSRRGEMPVTIVRPPLVYGPGVKANFRAMLRAIARGVPLPLGAVHNKRSLVALDNLVDFLGLCLEHPGAANEIFFISDNDDVSTTELLRRSAAALNVAPRLIPFPASLLELAALMVGKREAMQRLLTSLTVDITKSKSLGWSPPVTMAEGLRRAVEGGIE